MRLLAIITAVAEFSHSKLIYFLGVIFHLTFSVSTAHKR